MRTWPKVRASGASSTQAANASREAAATLITSTGMSGDVSDNLCLPSTSSNQVRHRGMGANRRTVEDSLVAARGGSDGHLAGETQVFGDGFAGVPAFGNKDGDQDDVLRLDVLHDVTDLWVLIQEPDLYEVVKVTSLYAVGVEVDDPAGTLVQVGTVSEQDERPTTRRDPLVIEQVLRPLHDYVRHPFERPQRPGIAHYLAALAGNGARQPELTRYYLLGEVPFRYEGRHHGGLLCLNGVEDVAHGRLLLPDALDNLVVLLGVPLPDTRRVLVYRQAGILAQMRSVPHDNESLHARDTSSIATLLIGRVTKRFYLKRRAIYCTNSTHRAASIEALAQAMET